MAAASDAESNRRRISVPRLFALSLAAVEVCALLETLGYVSRFALFLDQPEVWVLLDNDFHLVCDVPRRDRESSRFRAGLIPLRF